MPHSPPDGTQVALRHQTGGPTVECEVLDVARQELTISVDASSSTDWEAGSPVELLTGPAEPTPATIRSIYPNGDVSVAVLRAGDAAALASLAPSPMPASSNKRASFRTRVGPDAGIHVTVCLEESALPSSRARSVQKGHPGFLLDASFDGICVLVDRAAIAIFPKNGLVRVAIETPEQFFEIFGAVRHSAKVRLGAKLGIETGSFPHAHWPESQERCLRDFVLSQQRAELLRRRSA